MSDAHLDAATGLLKALASPLRLRIVLSLADQPQCVHDLVAGLGVAQPLVSQHLRVLRLSGLTSSERRGREIVYALADEHVGRMARDAIDHAKEQL
ncbi:MAG TPA: metalloregulator ArsR/SmtB family transcription factor [Egibacteraceae bacterium]|nr:metalloregulator ArsR/SmtB family transcription factor [Egibacteraceae bacterium]